MRDLLTDPQRRICGQRLANGTCKEMASVSPLYQYTDGKLSAIHRLIFCPSCETRIEIERNRLP